jgi:hypothetical protein
MWKARLLWLVVFILFSTVFVVYGQSVLTEDIYNLNKATNVLDPANGTGVMVSGELWDSFKPPNTGAWYGEATQPIIGHLFRIGNFDRAWSTPTHLWPGGWNMGNFWAKDMFMSEYNPDASWNPPTVAGSANPAHKAVAGGNYAVASFNTRVAGANDPNRTYTRETRWVDANKRHRALYECGFPTNIGVDVKVKIHQFSLNWNNINDFIIVELTLKNTGQVDINADGTVERTNNKINALTLLACGEFMSSYWLTTAATRGNSFGAKRAIGYIGDNDGTGSPWDMMIGYPGESATGKKDMGINAFSFRYYTDTWSSWAWLDAKKGDGTIKNTIYGTHPIGTGAQRGWFASGGQGRGLSIGASAFNNPKNLHVASMGTYFKDGGKSRDATKFDLSPDPNFFASGTPGNPVSFVPKPGPVTAASRPRGDRKLFSEESGSAFEVPTYESWTKGFTAENNFDGDMFSGIGPFSLDVGEEITVVWAEAGGFRLQGVTNAIAAARWAYARNYDLGFDYPAVPEMRVDNTLDKSTKIRWDNRANSGAGFAGYKIYRASQAKRINWLEGGMRELDDYWQNMTPGPTPNNLKKPVNPNFAGQAFVAGREGVPDSWGPYELLAVIPQAQLSQYADNSVSGYNYSYEDKTVELGFKYWYYVAAYTQGNYSMDHPAYGGTNPKTRTHIETSNINRNGASGLWENTYPFAEFNTFYPKDAAGQKRLGAGFVVKSALADPAKLASGASKISVKPNPYKKKALFDSAVDAFDHKVTFYNLPPKAKITILDVSGQIVQEINFASNDPNNGSTFWNLFSKDGVEVASGLYVYVVDYDGGQHIGYLSIMR